MFVVKSENKSFKHMKKTRGLGGRHPSGQNRQKKLKESVFVNSAIFKIQCRIKNTLLQTAFSAIFSKLASVVF